MKTVALVLLSLVLVAILVVVLPFALRILHIKRLMSGEHFAEMASLLAKVKDNAVQMRDKPEAWVTSGDEAFSDPRTAVSKHGLVIYYTCETADEVLHKISLSDRGGRLPYTAAGRLGALFFHQLGVALSRVAVGQSAAGVFHFHVELTEREHRALATRFVPIPKAREVLQLTDVGSEWMASLYQAGSIEAVPTAEEAGLAD